MNAPMPSLCIAAVLLLFASGAGAAEEPKTDSTTTAPAKKSTPKKKKKKPAPPKNAEAIPLELLLPPAEPQAAPSPVAPPAEAKTAEPLPSAPASPPKLEPPPLVTSDSAPATAEMPQLGIYRLVPPGTEDDPALRSIEDTFVDVAQASKRYRTVLKVPAPSRLCEIADDNCFALMGGLQQLDQVLVGQTLKAQNGVAVKVRLIDVQKSKAIGEKAQMVQSQDKDEIKVWAEALACDLINGAACKGQAIIDADLPEMRVVIDNLMYPRSGKNPETFSLPLGVHNVRVMVGERASLERKLLVSRAAPAKPALIARQIERGSIVLLRPQDAQPAPAASVATAQVQKSRWTRPAGLALAAAGLVAGGIGIYEGVHSKNLRDDANARYAQNNGVYLQSDVGTISSAKSAATTANVLYAVSAVALVAGLVVAFAF